MSQPTTVEPSLAVIEAKNLTKVRALSRESFAVRGLNLSIASGTTYGLIGPNGAGKTTTIKLLLGLLRPTAGTAEVLAKPAGHADALSQIGYLPESPYFYSHLTGREFLTFSGQLFGLESAVLKERIEKLLKRVSLEKRAQEKTGKYSKGMLQRLGLAQALVNDPQVLFLDEPMSGLDPQGRMDMRRILTELKAEGKTIFFNSHLLPDVALLCDTVGIMYEGQLVAQESIIKLSPERNAQELEKFFLEKTGGIINE